MYINLITKLSSGNTFTAPTTIELLSSRQDNNLPSLIPQLNILRDTLACTGLTPELYQALLPKNYRKIWPGQFHMAKQAGIGK